MKFLKVFALLFAVGASESDTKSTILGTLGSDVPLLPAFVSISTSFVNFGNGIIAEANALKSIKECGSSSSSQGIDDVVNAYEAETKAMNDLTDAFTNGIDENGVIKFLTGNLNNLSKGLNAVTASQNSVSSSLQNLIQNNAAETYVKEERLGVAMKDLTHSLAEFASVFERVKGLSKVIAQAGMRLSYSTLYEGNKVLADASLAYEEKCGVSAGVSRGLYDLYEQVTKIKKFI